MPEKTYHFELERKAIFADKWWEALPDITRVPIWEDLRGLTNHANGVLQTFPHITSSIPFHAFKHRFPMLFIIER